MHGFGGVLYTYISTITIGASVFHNNSVNYGSGGVLLSSSSTITLEASKFHANSVPTTWRSTAFRK